jgi:hypothetical protein
MVGKVKPQDLNITLKFGGGLHTRASTDEVDPREATDGNNFILNLDNRELRPRPPFDLVGQLPNKATVMGGGSLLTSNGTVSTIFQGGGVVYEWDGGTGFNTVGTCSASAKLRGHWRSHNWTLGDKLLLSDLALADVVKQWDGTTFASVAFTNTSGASFGTFGAKYIDVNNERALFANIKDNTNPFPHLMAGSEQSNYLQISSQAPSSSLSESDPFYMTAPDLKPINGLVDAFGTRVISTEKGSLYTLEGASAKDFKFDDFFAGSAASGAESISYIGNDVIYGRQGRIESVRDTSAFGNSEADDISLKIADQVGDFTGWTIVYNGRNNFAYLFPADQSEVWVFNTAMRTARILQANALDQFVNQQIGAQVAGKLSPWMRWKTQHAMAFQPTFVDSMLDPVDGLEYVFMGDDSGNIYRMEGSGGDGDGGTKPIDTSWTSKVFSAPMDAEAYDLEGYIKYKKNLACSVVLTILWQGKTAFDQSVTVDLPGVSNSALYFGGPNYFGDDIYFGVRFQSRILRQYFTVPGQSNDFQIKIEVDDVALEQDTQA